jgi:hypothetical protein
MEDQMIKKFDFIDKIIYLIRKELEQNLPSEDTLEEMYNCLEKILNKIVRGK